MSITRRRLMLSTLAVPLAQAQTKKLSALVIDGMNNHDWEVGTKVIRAVLEATGRFTVDVTTTPPREAPAAAWDGWQPKFDGYNVVINNFNGGHLPDGIRWPQRVEESLDAYVRRGGGFVSYHAANNAFLKWEAYSEMVGLAWRDKAFGPGLVIDDRERVVVAPAGEGLGPGHGPAHNFVMTMRDPRHPITRGLPKEWMHPMEQLTHGQHAPINQPHGPVEKELHIVTYAMSKDSHRREPMDWVRTWERGRVYVTMLGHTWRNQENPNCRCVGFQTLLARGVEWAATGKVTLPVPSKFPTVESPLYSSIVNA